MSGVRSTKVRLGLSVLLGTVLTGCGLIGPDTYEPGERDVQAEVGEEFTLAVPVDIAMGEWWFMTSPKPDRAVVRSTGFREETEDSGDLIGAGKGTKYFDFKAVGEGTTEIRLIQCPHGACVGGGDSGEPAEPEPIPSGSPTPQAKYRAVIHTYTVTVK